jgi:hypothetical protein
MAGHTDLAHHNDIKISTTRACNALRNRDSSAWQGQNNGVLTNACCQQRP